MESISNMVVEDFLVENASEEVITAGIHEVLFAVSTGNRGKSGDNWEAQFLLSDMEHPRLARLMGSKMELGF